MGFDEVIGDRYRGWPSMSQRLQVDQGQGSVSPDFSLFERPD